MTVFAVASAVAETVSYGDPGFPPVPTATDPDFIAARKAIEAKEWKKAIDLLKKVSVNTDVHNFLGYLYLHLRNFPDAFQNCKRAWYAWGQVANSIRDKSCRIAVVGTAKQVVE